MKANEPMKTLRPTAHDDKEEWTNRYELTPSGLGTTVTKTVIWPPLTGRSAARSAIFAVFVNRGMNKGLSLLKERAKRRNAGSSSR